MQQANSRVLWFVSINNRPHDRFRSVDSLGDREPREGLMSKILIYFRDGEQDRFAEIDIDRVLCELIPEAEQQSVVALNTTARLDDRRYGQRPRQP
jgi:hypothetical protein